MIMFQLLGLFSMVGMLLFVALCVMTIVRALVIPAEVRRGSRCGGCGYEIASLSTDRCSECGAFLLRVGVTTPAMIVRHRSSGLAAGLAWTALVGSLSMLTMSFLSMATMNNMNYQANQQITSSNTFTPRRQWDPQTQQRSGNDYSLLFDVDVITDEDGEVESGEIEIEFTNGSNESAIALIDPLTFSYTIDDIAQEGTFDTEAAIALFESVGYDPESESIQSEASQVNAMVEEVPSDPKNFESVIWNGTGGDPMTSLQSNGGSSSSMPAGGIGPMTAGAGPAIGMMAFWFVVWGVGLVLMNWRRRRLFAAT